jgi:hypothetical protein
MDRRSFLRTTAGGTAAIAAASLLPAGCARDYPHAESDSYTLAALTPKEYAVMRATAEALLEGVPVEPSLVAQRVDRELAMVGEPVRTDMKTVLRIMQHATPLGGHLRPFTALTPADRLRYLNGWARSRFDLRRAAFQALKGFTHFFAYIDDRTRGITGFEGPWPERFDLPVVPVDYGEVA